MEPLNVTAVRGRVVVIENEAAVPNWLRLDLRIAVFVKFSMSVSEGEGFAAVVIARRIILNARSAAAVFAIHGEGATGDAVAMFDREDPVLRSRRVSKV